MIKPKVQVWSYLDLLDPNRIFVVPTGYNQLCLAACSCDWGKTRDQIGFKINPNIQLPLFDSNGQQTGQVPDAVNDRWFIPQGVVTIDGKDLTGTFPGSYYESYSTTYSYRVPPFVSFSIEGVDAPDNRVAILTPANEQINNGAVGTMFNIVDRNLKIRLYDAWGHSINNMTFCATIILTE